MTPRFMRTSTGRSSHLGHAAEDLKRLDWRLREVLLVPVERLT
jgi:hypothetical protein